MAEHDPFSICDKQAAQEAQVLYRADPEPPDSEGGSCSIIKTPVTIMAAMVSVIRQWFGSPERVTLDRGRFHWNPDLAESGIFIATDYPWNNNAISGKPGVFIEHGSITSIPIRSIGMGQTNAIGFDSKTGTITCASQYSADISFRCMCRANLEAWALANEVKVLFETFGAGIAKEYGLHWLGIRGVQKPVPVKDYDDFMTASVALNYTLMSVWKVALEGLPLQSIYGVPIPERRQKNTPVFLLPQSR